MSDWSEPADGPATGHAAVGFVVGQRSGGTAPKFVDIKYRRDGETAAATVRRETKGLQVEYDETDTARFETVDDGMVCIDELLAAKPAFDD